MNPDMSVSFKKILSAAVAGALALALAACTPSMPGAPTDPNGPGVSGPGIETPGTGGTGNEGGGQGPSAPDASTARGQIALTVETFYSGIINDFDEKAFESLEEIGEYDPTNAQELMLVLSQYEQLFPAHLRELIHVENSSHEERILFWSILVVSATFGQIAKMMAPGGEVSYTVDQSQIQINGNTATVPGSAISTNMGVASGEQQDVNLVYVNGQWKISMGF